MVHVRVNKSRIYRPCRQAVVLWELAIAMHDVFGFWNYPHAS